MSAAGACAPERGGVMFGSARVRLATATDDADATAIARVSATPNADCSDLAIVPTLRADGPADNGFRVLQVGTIRLFG
jgi:hypothetical protein